MSNIGRKKINVPESVTIEIKDDNIITFNGKLGSITEKFSKDIDIIRDKNVLRVISNDSSIQGTERSRINNAILGVSQGFKFELKLVGIGYRAQVTGNILNLKIGLTHPLEIELPEGISAICPKPDVILLYSIKKGFLNHFANKIHKLKKPDPYKGKGIQLGNKVLKLKEGKEINKKMLRRKVYNTNKSQYFQVLLNEEPIITLKSKKSKHKDWSRRNKNNLLFKVYQEQKLSLSTFNYLKEDFSIYKKSIIANALEFSIESGLVKNKL